MMLQKMTVYKINADYDQYLSFTVKNTELYSKMPEYSARFSAKSRLEKWIKPEAMFYSSQNFCGNPDALADITLWCSGNLVLNVRAYMVLQQALCRVGEFLPVSCAGVNYHIFNILNVIPDAIVDKENTKECYEGKVYMGLTSLAFHTSELAEHLIFKTNADKRVSAYCTDAFKQLIDRHKLKGLRFETNLLAL